MFERLEVWIFIGIAFVTLFCGLDAWITNLYRRIKEQTGDIRRLRRRLNEAEQENAWLIARCESQTDHRVLIRDTQIDDLTAELAATQQKVQELETLLDQKWKESKKK